MKTKRFVLVPPEQKRALARRAKVLDELIAELRQAVRESRAALRAALSEAEATLRQIVRRRRVRRVT